ncbi:MAG: sulfotransferase family protein [Almyronema sp.]
MPKPSFFIVGAPKCGTTALCKYLNRHPDIFIPQLKELHYFDTDLKTKSKAHSRSEYLALFADGAGKICGEGTPTYLYSKTAAEEIYRFEPKAKIIIMLREPISMMYALHSQHLFNGSSETVPDFEKALMLEPERKIGKHIPDRCVEPKILFYREIASFTAQVKRYLDIFGKAQVKIILFDEFTQATEKICQETFLFLGVNPTFETDFSPINANKKVRSYFLQKLLKYPPAEVLAVGKYLVPLPQSWRRKLLETTKAALKRLNTEQKPRPPLATSLKKRLSEEFVLEVQQLANLIGRDLNHWL